MKRIAINGFGRMGKLLLRRLIEMGVEKQLVLINEVNGDAKCFAHQLEFDTIHGQFDAGISPHDGKLKSGRHSIAVSHARKISAIPLEDHRIDLVIDCTGAHRTKKTLEKYNAFGVKKVLVACPASKPALNLVFGVNHDLYDPKVHHIVTAASCTTNCIAPIVKVIHESIGIEHGSITTIHNATNTQTVVDRPGKDTRRSRSGVNSMFPSTTGSAKAIADIFPELTGKLNGYAVRVPLLNASLTDCVFEVQRSTTVEEVNGMLEAASVGKLADLLGYETRQLVSADYVNDARSSIVDASSTMVINETQVKLCAWYDNEWGYACRLCDIARYMLRQSRK